LGIVAVSLTPQVAYANDLPIERGALILRLEGNGAAAEAGFQPGDVVTSVAGRPVRNLHDLHDLLFRRRPGDVVEVTLWRQGRVLTLRPVLQDER
jgi:S1-C subfamily serine protease